MSKTRYRFILQVASPALIIAIFFAGICLSFFTKDPHWLNRAGALIAAIAALLILVQISAEIRIEHEIEAVDTNIRVIPTNNSVLTPLEKLENKLALNQLLVKRSKILGRRLRVAFFVVVAAMIGEILHGFGDLIMCYGFGICAGH